MSTRKHLQAAKNAKNDEYYTRYQDVEAELSHYQEFLKGKTVYCPCDTIDSAFYKYFVNSFNQLQLKKLICSSIHGNTVIINGFGIEDDIEERIDCLSEAANKYYEQADVVVTNPPFSLFKKFYAKLKSFKIDFIVLGNNNTCTYKGVVPDIRDGKCSVGYTRKTLGFKVPDDYEMKSNVKIVNGEKLAGVATMWFTSYPVDVDCKLKLTSTYDPKKYPKYDNYDAINVDSYKDIPMDYSGVMGVPISFMNHYCKEQFELLGSSAHEFGSDLRVKIYNKPIQHNEDGTTCIANKLNDAPAFRKDLKDIDKFPYYEVDGKFYTSAYSRIFIKRRDSQPS